ncbi:hypothetical protein DdX_03246 [Ditylenchus destructor]|uniref:Uncharacterized protein n=1 Tax=Ditylenchus destructor TaxID=166010 RepID=A0AAD4NFW1_9BILA|nr:hypothetical protein DdX_03246 [Ditylenchus destructor]
MLNSLFAADVALIVSNSNRAPFYLFRKNYSYLFRGNNNYLASPHKRKDSIFSESDADGSSDAENTWDAPFWLADEPRQKRVHSLSLLRYNGKLSHGSPYGVQTLRPAFDSEAMRTKRVHSLSLLRLNGKFARRLARYVRQAQAITLDKRVHNFSLLRGNGKFARRPARYVRQAQAITLDKRVHNFSLLRGNGKFARRPARYTRQTQAITRDKRVHNLSLLRVNGKLFYPQSLLSAASEQQKRFSVVRRRLLQV